MPQCMHSNENLTKNPQSSWKLQNYSHENLFFKGKLWKMFKVAFKEATRTLLLIQIASFVAVACVSN